MMPALSIKLCAIASYCIFHSHAQDIISYWLDEVNGIIGSLLILRFCVTFHPSYLQCSGEPDENDNERGRSCNVCETNQSEQLNAKHNKPSVKIPPLLPCQDQSERNQRAPPQLHTCGEGGGGGVGGNEADDSSGVDCGEDCGTSSRESSEVACSDGLCNHDREGGEIFEFMLHTRKLKRYHHTCRGVIVSRWFVSVLSKHCLSVCVPFLV